METSLAKNIIREISENNLTKCVTFHIMGEPLLHPDVVELCRFAEDSGVAVSLFTNGALLNQQMNNRLFAAGLSKLDVSFRTPNGYAFKKRINSKMPTFETY